jgi:hypothetical protein
MDTVNEKGLYMIDCMRNTETGEVLYPLPTIVDGEIKVSDLQII